MSKLRGQPLYPATIAAACILATYVQPIPPLYMMVRPVIVAVALMVGLQLVFWLLARDRHRGAFFGTVLGLFLAVWKLGILIFAVAIGQLILATIRRRRLATIDWPQLTRFLNAMSAIVLIVTVLMGAGHGALPNGPSRPPGQVAAGLEPPDIYLLMFDGYPRADTLARQFGYDNSPFLDGLTAEGFHVADDAHSNYNITWLTLSSMFNAEHIASLMPEIPNGIEAQLSAFNHLINTGKALEAARDAGYELIAVSGGRFEADLTSADRFIDTGQVNDFEAPMLRTGLVPYILPKVQAAVLHGQLRDRFTATVEVVERLAREQPVRPRLVFVHFHVPHPPIVFDANGGDSGDDGCYPLACGLFDQAYDVSEPQYLRGELDYINSRILEMTTQIEAGDRSAAVVVFSDHGFRADHQDFKEMVHNLFASYTPDASDLFPDDASPINILPTLLNHYAGTSIPFAADESYVRNFDEIHGSRSHFPLIRTEP